MRWIVCALATAPCLAAILLVAPTSTPDSFHYMDVAEQLVQGQGPTTLFLSLDARSVPAPIRLWPPGFPAALAVPLAFGLGSTSAVQLVNALALLSSALAIRVIARECGLQGLWAEVALLACLLHSFVRLVFSRAWSEPLFLAFVLGAVALWLSAWKRRSLGRMATAGLLMGLACTVRFMGLPLALGLIMVTFHPAFFPRELRYRMAGAFGTVATLVAAAVPAATYAATRLWPDLLQRPAAYGLVFGLARRLNQSLASTDGLLAPAGIALLALFASRRVPAGMASGEGVEPRYLSAQLAVGALGAAYLVSILLTLARLQTDPIDGRLLAPVAPLATIWLLARSRFWLVSSSPPGLAVGILLALNALLWVRGAALRQQEETPPPPATAILEAWLDRHASTQTLVVASRGWMLRRPPGAAVLEDGYSEMPPLSPEAAAAFVRRHSERFDRLLLVLGDDTPTTTVALRAEYEAAFGADGWRLTAQFGTPGDGRILLRLDREERSFPLKGPYPNRGWPVLGQTLI